MADPDVTARGTATGPETGPEDGPAAATVADPAASVAAARGVEKAPAARSRRARGLAAIGTFAAFALAGGLFATSASTADGDQLRADAADLPTLVATQENRVSARTADVEALRQEVDSLSSEAGDPVAASLAERAEKLGTEAAVAGASGEGVQVVLDDAPRGTVSDVDPDLLLVHQEDLQAVINALWAGGATAVSLMDQPLIATSAVRCVGSTLRLQGRLYAPPYQVRAVGDPAELTAALEADENVQEYRAFQALGLGWELTSEAAVTVPPWEGPLRLRWASAPPA